MLESRRDFQGSWERGLYAGSSTMWALFSGPWKTRGSSSCCCFVTWKSQLAMTLWVCMVQTTGLLFGEMVPRGSACENSHPANYHSEGWAATRRLSAQAEAGQPQSCSLSLTVFSALKARQERGREKPHYREEGRQKAAHTWLACMPGSASERQGTPNHFCTATEACQLPSYL